MLYYLDLGMARMSIIAVLRWLERRAKIALVCTLTLSRIRKYASLEGRGRHMVLSVIEV